MMRQSPPPAKSAIARIHRIDGIFGLFAMLACTTLLTGCYASYHAKRGDVHMQREDFGRAVSSYLAAQREVQRGKERRSIDVRLRRALARLTEEEVKAAQTLAKQGHHDRAWKGLVELRNTLQRLSAWSHLSDTVAPTMDAVADKLFEAVQALWKAGKHEADVVAAARLAAPMPPDSRTAQRYQQTRRALANLRVQQANAAGQWPGAKVIYLEMARRHGADVKAELVDANAAVSQITSIAWAPAASGSCGADARSIAGRLRSSNGRPVTVQVQVDSCTPRKKAWNRSEPYSFTVNEEYWYSATETDYSNCRTSTSNCKTGTRRYPLGNGKVRIEYYKYGCDSRRICGTKVVRKKGTRKVTKRGYRAVSYVQHTYRMNGRATVQWEGKERTVRIDGDASIKGSSYTSPHGNKSLPSEVSGSTVRNKVLSAAVSKIRGIGSEVQADRAREARAKLAAATTDAERDHWGVILWRLVGMAPPESVRSWHARFGLEGKALMGALKGEPPPKEKADGQLKLPEADADVAAAVDRLQPVTPRDRSMVADDDAGNALDVDYLVNKSPFSYLYYVHSMRVTRRANLGGGSNAMSASLSAEFGSPTLGSRKATNTMLRSEGMVYAVEGRYSIGLMKNGPTYEYGLRWGKQLSPMGTHLHMLGFIMGQRFPIGAHFALSWQMALNMMAIRDWTADEPLAHEKHWTPFTIGAAIRPFSRWVVRGTMTWWWGAPDGVHLGFSTGVRF